VAVDGPLDFGGADCLSHGTLDDPFMDVVAADGARSRIGRDIASREEPLPSPFLFGPGVFPFKGERHVNASPGPGELLVELLHPREPGDELGPDGRRQRDEAILVPLRVADEDPVEPEFDVLD